MSLRAVFLAVLLASGCASAAPADQTRLLKYIPSAGMSYSTLFYKEFQGVLGPRFQGENNGGWLFIKASTVDPWIFPCMQESNVDRAERSAFLRIMYALFAARAAGDELSDADTAWIIANAYNTNPQDKGALDAVVRRYKAAFVSYGVAMQACTEAVKVKKSRGKTHW